MAVTAVPGGTSPAFGVVYTHITDSSSDWASVSNSTYFYDKTDNIVYYKDSSGTVLSLFVAGGSTVKGQENFGIHSSDASSGTAGSGTQYNTIIIPHTDMTVDAIGYWVAFRSSTENVYVGIYSEDGLTKHANGSGDTATAGYRTAALDSSYTMTAGTPYFISILCGSGSPSFVMDTTSFGNTAALLSSAFVSTTPTASAATISSHTNTTTAPWLRLIGS